MEPQQNLKDSRAHEVHAQAVYAAPSAPGSNDAMLAMVGQMRNEAAADRQAAAADRERAADERRLHEQNQQRNLQHPAQQQQPMPYGQPQYQQPMGQGTTTVVQIPNDDIDHCQHFVCCLFLGGFWTPFWLLACIIPGFCPTPCSCNQQQKTVVITRNP